MKFIGEEILKIEMVENDAGAETIRDYLKALVRLVYKEDEGFSGKRPFGNSGWWSELNDSIDAAFPDSAEDEIDHEYLINLAIDAL